MTGTRELTLEQLAESAGMTPRNVRAYQARGLLPPPHREGRSVRYGPEHVARLRLVRVLLSRGLSLRVVRDLLDRGDAEVELARLSRNRLLASWGEDALVPLISANVEAFREAAPGVLEEMVEAGILVRDGERLLASSTALGLVSALLVHEVDLVASARITQLAATAAHSVLADLKDQLEAAGATSEKSMSLAVQLAGTAFSDVLARKLELG
ncbi:MAG: MerR family transcriptional regulator [Actinomycetota bacterium]